MLNKESSQNTAVIALSALVVFICGCFLIIKLKLLYGLAYTSDLFIHTQKSRSFLYGLPLLYDNIHGPHPYHNTFLELALSPFSALFGASGLIAAYWVICSSVFTWMIYSSRVASASGRVYIPFMLLISLLGPIGFWTFDNPVYGWHPEMLSLPCGLGLAVSLIEGRRALTLIFSLACLLTHEIGAVLAASIHLLFFYIRQLPSTSGFRHIIRRHVEILWPWVILFAAGLIIQRLWDSAGSGRLDGVIQQLQTEAGRKLVVGLISPLLELLAISSLGFLALTRSVKHVLLILFCATPAILAGAGAGLAYGDFPGADMHNIFWPPRWSFIWAITISGTFFSLFNSSNCRNGMSGLILSASLLTVVLIWCQDNWLRKYRSYDATERVTKALGGYIRPLFSQKELSLINCLSDRISKRNRVVLPGSMWALFEAHDIEFLNPSNPYRADPSILLCDLATRTPFDYDCLKKQEPYSTNTDYMTKDFESLRITFRKRLRDTYRLCRKSLLD
jgi:hypothetical protein